MLIKYMWCFIKHIFDILLNDARFANSLITQEDNFDFSFTGHGTHRVIHSVALSLLF